MKKGKFLFIENTKDEKAEYQIFVLFPEKTKNDKHIAYQINGFNEGLFAFIVFQAEEKTIRKLEKIINHTDEVIQHMIIKKEMESSKQLYRLK